MPAQRPDRPLSRLFVGPVAMILGLIVVFWLLADWDQLPRLISATLHGTH
jgi:hypothetical protein